MLFSIDMCHPNKKTDGEEIGTRRVLVQFSQSITCSSTGNCQIYLKGEMGGVDSLCSAVFTRLLLEPGLTEVLGQIVGTSVVLHHTKVKITRST